MNTVLTGDPGDRSTFHHPAPSPAPATGAAAPGAAMSDAPKDECGVFGLWAPGEEVAKLDRKSTRLNSSHVAISYAVFCLKKKKKTNTTRNHASPASRMRRPETMTR